MLLIRDGEIVGSAGWNSDRENPYIAMRPWQHESGANIWIISDYGLLFTDDDDTEYIIRKRTDSEIKETTAYKTWKSLQPLPKMYAILNITGGDEKIPVGLSENYQIVLYGGSKFFKVYQ